MSPRSPALIIVVASILAPSAIRGIAGISTIRAVWDIGGVFGFASIRRIRGVCGVTGISVGAGLTAGRQSPRNWDGGWTVTPSWSDRGSRRFVTPRSRHSVMNRNERTLTPQPLPSWPG